MPAIAQTAVCLVPRGIEEGFSAQLDGLDFEARTNQPVAFQILASSTRTGDELGQVVKLAPGEAVRAAAHPHRAALGRRGEARTLPVTLGVHLTEVGTLALFCRSRQTDHRWQLQFDVRQSAAAGEDGADGGGDAGPGRGGGGPGRDSRTFAASGGDKPLPPESVRRNLEETLALPKEHWPTPLIRALADALLDAAQGRSGVARARGALAQHAGLLSASRFWRPGGRVAHEAGVEALLRGTGLPAPGAHPHRVVDLLAAHRRRAQRRPAERSCTSLCAPICSRPNGARRRASACPSTSAAARCWRSG